MTAQQVAELGRAAELPLAASLPEVDVQATAGMELDQCGVHVLLAEEDMAPLAKWEISYQFGAESPVRYEKICGRECAQAELQELLDWGVYRLALHLPSDWAETPPVTGGDVAFSNIRDCVARLENMPNTATSPAGQEGFEACRKLAIAAVSQTGMRRIQDLESSAA